ncbi:MAG: DUF1294 domain-containing protein [Pseudomonadales bacterium]
MLAGASIATYAASRGLLDARPLCGAALGALAAANLLSAPLLYGWDKWRAVAGHSSRRIPEAALHAVSLSGGALGAFVSARLFRHKTSKGSFQLRFWMTVPVSLGIYYGVYRLCG